AASHAQDRQVRASLYFCSCYPVPGNELSKACESDCGWVQELYREPDTGRDVCSNDRSSHSSGGGAALLSGGHLYLSAGDPCRTDRYLSRIYGHGADRGAQAASEQRQAGSLSRGEAEL